MKLMRVLVVLSFFLSPCAYGQFGGWKSLAKKAVEKAGEKKEAPAPESKPAEPTNSSASNSSASANSGAAPTTSSTAAGGAAATPASANPGEGAWANYDFVPGERVLFKDDFTDERVGNFPRRLEFVDGNAEVVTWNGGKWLRSSSDTTIAIPLPETLPDRFTMEFQVTLPRCGFFLWGGPNPRDVNAGGHTYAFMDCCDHGLVTPGDGPTSTTDARTQFDFGDAGFNNHLFNVRIQGDGKYMKMYLEEKRLANLPNGTFLHGNKIYLLMKPCDNIPVMFGNVSINAGGTEMYQALMQDGHVATQGIYFDVDSDRLRPESTPTLNEIADMLKEHTDLKIRIEGHTDSTGQAAHNQDLSERRAASVKTYLVSKGGVDAARLTSQGFGAIKPVASNDTPEGRQANRRVELVKI